MTTSLRLWVGDILSKIAIGALAAPVDTFWTTEDIVGGRPTLKRRNPQISDLGAVDFTAVVVF
jgi:hypothetical protein